MKKAIKFAANKFGFMAAIALSAIVGGLSTGVALATIPDSNGDVQSCYSNSGGALRVIDTDTESCETGETALNLGNAAVKSTTAFFAVKNGAVDTASMRNIDHFQWYEGGEETGWAMGYCLKTSFETVVNLSTSQGNPHHIESRTDGEFDASIVDQYCGPNFNAFVSTGYEFDEVTAWFSR